MRMAARGLVLLGMVSVGLGVSAWGQDVSVPFTWEGKGATAVMLVSEVQTVHFTLKLDIDSQGAVTGAATAEDGKAEVRKLYYSDKGAKGRELVVVMTLEDSDDPLLILFKGRSLNDSFFFGEVYEIEYDPASTVVKDLSLKDNIATPIYEGYSPKSLENALKAAKPVGSFAVEGDFAG